MNDSTGPIELSPAQKAIVARCGWFVKRGQRGWHCTEEFGHDQSHRLRIGTRVVASASGFDLD